MESLEMFASIVDDTVVRAKLRQLSHTIGIIVGIDANDIAMANRESRCAWYATEKDFVMIASEDTASIDIYNFYVRKLNSCTLFLRLYRRYTTYPWGTGYITAPLA